MKKLIITILAICFIASPLCASLVPFNDYYFDKDDIFSSPALLIEREEVTHFGFEITAMSSIDYMSYLADPSSRLSESSDYLYTAMMNGNEDFWNENYGALAGMFSFDSLNLPSYSQPLSEADIAQIKSYLSESYSNRFDSNQKASAVLSAVQNTDIFSSPSAPELNGSMNLSLKMYGGEIYNNGFGWRIKSNIGIAGSENMLSSNASILGVDIRGDVGYAFHIINEHFTIGTSLEAGLFANNSIINYMLLNSRFSGTLAISEPFKLGFGISLNAGVMYRHSENLAFTLDLTNLISLRKYSDMALTDFVDFDGLDNDPNVYYQPMDAVIRARWDYGPYHVVAEMGDIVRQLFWMKEDKNMAFNFYAVPKAYFIYDFSEELSINTGLEYSSVLFGVEYAGLNAEISFSFSDLSIGLKAGYRF